MSAPAKSAATRDEAAELRSTIEGMSIVGCGALRAIGTLASLALHECERGKGMVSAALVIGALRDICYRADDADNCLVCDAQRHGLADTDADMYRRLDAVAALGDALNARQPAGAHERQARRMECEPPP
jgi:hypothetical protein